MKRSLLIADSGGTSTDWCYVDPDGKCTYFTTESYHPAQFSTGFLEKMSAFWKAKNFPAETAVYFYGAGCSMQHNQEIVAAHFKSVGFEKVAVESDLMGTCRALLGNRPGLVGILGTGSVLAEYDGTAIVTIHGGFGYLLGDEGSGYAFGKKLLHNYLNKEFSTALMSLIANKIGERSNILQHVYASGGKQWISDLAPAFGGNEEIEQLHRENISEFVELYLQKLNPPAKNICFSGSYAFYNQKTLSSVLAENGWTLTDCVQKPIEKITVYTMKATL